MKELIEKLDKVIELLDKKCNFSIDTNVTFPPRQYQLTQEEELGANKVQDAFTEAESLGWTSLGRLPDEARHYLDKPGDYATGLMSRAGIAIVYCPYYMLICKPTDTGYSVTKYLYKSIGEIEVTPTKFIVHR